MDTPQDVQPKDSQSPTPAVQSTDGMSNGFKVILVIVAAVVMGVAVWWIFFSAATPILPESVPVAPRPGLSGSPSAEKPDDSSASISRSLDSVQVDDLNAELQKIDSDLQGL
jgi:hypothetical protein